ncbi:hypothetical protein Bca4012_083980 [Brassica carinata]|uniref:Ubiquitin-like protease family profile domain-containing protein n=1 Tax=Brassica carinata TaxID=52824 RepID=A0A8X7SLA6_BRACI|nr:hypothetical protein Bca52824_026822 [Brassica carinata]
MESSPWVTCMCPRSMNEVHPVWEHQDEDPEIDNLLEFFRQEKSLSTITWQALPEYPLTPIKCNKRRCVASQQKSKKSKKLASREQENVGDGGENSGDIAENEDQVESDDDEGKYFIQRRQTPERLFSMERPDVGTLQKSDPFGRKRANPKSQSRTYSMSKYHSSFWLKSQRLSKEEEEDIVNESAKTLALMGSKTLVVGTGDNQLKSLDDAKVQPLTGNEDEPHKASSNIITPSKPIRKSARVAALSEKSNTNYLVLYGPVDKAKVKALNAFVKTKGDSTYPPGDVLMAKDFFKRFHKPRGWLSFTELDVPLAMYKLRFSKNPSDFISPRISIMDAVFPTWCCSRHKEWLRDQSKIPTGAYDYYIGKRPTISPTGKQWGRDVDTLYSVLMVDNCHWVLMVISFPDRTIKIYDSSTDLIDKDTF